MISWKELSVLDLGHAREEFPRSEASLAAYNRHKRYLESVGLTAEKYIEMTILQGNDHGLSVNAFPYAVSPGIRHLVFWMGKSCEKVPMSVVKGLTANSLGVSGENVIVFENPPSLRSIPGLDHYQVFVKG